MDTHKSDFDKVVHKAISDESFREKLKTDPHGALKDAGVEPTEEKVAALRHAAGPVSGLHKAFGGHGDAH